MPYELETEVALAYRDYLVEGTINDVVAGVDSEGEPIYDADVDVRSIYVYDEGAQDWLRLLPSERAFMLLLYGERMEEALLDQAQADYESYIESRGY